MRIKIADLKEALFVNNRLVFEASGFILKNSHTRYEKTIDDFKFVFKFLFHGLNAGISIQVFALVYYLPAEKIYRKASNLSMETIGNEIGALRNNPDGLFVNQSSNSIYVYELNELDSAIEKILEMFNSIALPYFQKYNTIEVLDHVLNDNPTEISVHAPQQYYRCPNALIIAKLVGRENYAELEKIYDARMATVNEMDRGRYKNVKALLNYI